ncbi:MAG: carbohydrate-binding domain-containing protein [Clostridia bacterium]|nr:carbohydrate-binding domain-containing protein [Clostridia bacterium]
MKKLICISIAILLLLSGCAKEKAKPETVSESGAQTLPQSTDEMFSERDVDPSYDSAQSITLTGEGIKTDSENVRVSGTTATITKEGTYLVSGTLKDGMLLIDAADTAKVQIVLNGADITSGTSAPIYVRQADKVFVTLAEGSDNSITAGGSFVLVDENEIDGAIFSKDDLTVGGSGSLKVSSPAGHGIVAKDDLALTGGNINIECASHGIDANDSVRVKSASLTVDSGKDGIHCENNDDTSLGFVYIESGSFDIAAEGDGISAASYMQITGGDFKLLTGGGSVNAQKKTSDSWGGMGGGGRPGGGMHGGMGGPMARPTSTMTAVTETETDEEGTSIKGIKSGGAMQISGGSFEIDSADDALHSNLSITVTGGSFEIKTGDDGFHADETLTVENGSINITESYEGLEALDIKLSGGDIKLVASDDGLNAAGGTDMSGFGGVRGDEGFGRGPMGGGASNGSIVISGGTLYANASGDGIDANGSFEMTGGNVTVCGPTRGDTATLDYDVSATVSGGTFIGTGGAGMAQTFSDAKQGLISISVGNQSAGTNIKIVDNSGKELVSYAPELDFAVVIISSPDIKSGESYKITIGNQSETITAN